MLGHIYDLASFCGFQISNFVLGIPPTPTVMCHPANKEPFLNQLAHIIISYWFIIGTAPPVRDFMCIHVNTRILPVVTSFEPV